MRPRLIIIHFQKNVGNWYVWQESMTFCCLQKMYITYCVMRANVLLDYSFMMTSKILLFTYHFNHIQTTSHIWPYIFVYTMQSYYYTASCTFPIELVSLLGTCHNNQSIYFGNILINLTFSICSMHIDWLLLYRLYRQMKAEEGISLSNSWY